MADASYSLTRGDKWEGPTVTITKSAFDFAGCTVVSKIKENARSFDTLATCDVTLDTSVVGTAVAVLSIDGSITDSFPILSLAGDIVVSRVSPAFGPFTVATYTINMAETISNE